MLPAPTASKTCAKHSLRHSFNPQHFSLLDSHISTPTNSASHVHCCGRSYPLPPPCPSQALAFLYAICYCHSSTPGDAACCWPCAARCVVLLHALPLLAVLLAACLLWPCHVLLRAAGVCCYFALCCCAAGWASAAAASRSPCCSCPSAAAACSCAAVWGCHLLLRAVLHPRAATPASPIAVGPSFLLAATYFPLQIHHGQAATGP
jgi:hypothetical protein